MTAIVDFKGLRARALGLAAVCVSFTALAPAPAHAQLFGAWGYQRFDVVDSLPPREIARRLARQGYRLIGPLQRNGQVLVADASDSRGRTLRLIIDPAEGEVLQRFLNAEPRPGRDVPGGYRERQTLEDADEATPEPNAKKPAPKPKVAVRSVPQKPKAEAARPRPSEARAPQRIEDPVAARRDPPPVARDPEVAAAPAQAPRAAPVPAAPASAARQAETPGYVQGVPVNPLD